MDIDRAMLDRRLLGAALGDDLATWLTWLATLKAAFGLELNRAERRLFASVAGHREPPAKRVRELWCVVSRRAGKSRMAAAMAAGILPVDAEDESTAVSEAAAAMPDDGEVSV